MNLAKLKPCCSSPKRKVQGTRVESSSPLVAPLWLCRIVCDSCGKASPYCDSLNKACKWWNKKERRREVKVAAIGKIAKAYICDDLHATGIVIEAAPDELNRLLDLVGKEVEVKAKEGDAE